MKILEISVAIAESLKSILMGDYFEKKCVTKISTIVTEVIRWSGSICHPIHAKGAVVRKKILKE